MEQFRSPLATAGVPSGGVSGGGSGGGSSGGSGGGSSGGFGGGSGLGPVVVLDWVRWWGWIGSVGGAGLGPVVVLDWSGGGSGGLFVSHLISSLFILLPLQQSVSE